MVSKAQRRIQELNLTLDASIDEGKVIESCWRGAEKELKDTLRQNEDLEERLERLEAFEGLEGVDFYEEWSEQLIETAGTAWDGRLKSRYKRVKVLLVQWASDDLNVEPELDWLRNVFDYIYNYEVTKFSIPDVQPSIALSAALAIFIGDQALDTLLIFCYSGHGDIDPARNQSYWSACVHLLTILLHEG